MSTEIAATIDNFEAQLAAADAADARGDSGEGDSAPANDNGWAPQLQSDDAQSDHPLNPHQSQDLRDITDAQDTPRDDVEEEEPQEEGEEQEFEEGEEQPEEEQSEGPSHEELRQMYEALQAEDLHEGLLDKYGVANGNGRQLRVTMREALAGYQRQADYSRGKAEVAELQRQTEEYFTKLKQVTASWKDPKGLRSTVRRLGLEDSFRQAAAEWAIEEHRINQMSPEAREAYQRAQKLEFENERLRELALRAQRQQQAAPPQYEPVLRQHIAQVLPQTLQRYGLEDNAATRHFMQIHVTNMWDRNPETTAQALDAAARATLDDLQALAVEHAASYMQQAPANTNYRQEGARQLRQRAQQSLGPRRVPGATRPPSDKVRAGGTSSDFSKLFKV